jgi:hypothetical protein
MKLVYGDQVIENATVTVQSHNKPERTKQLIELTVPADASNGGYAVRQLLGQDPDIGAKSVVTLEVDLTEQQIERLKNITEDELRGIRNGVNPAMIYGVRVYDSEPMSFEEFITGKKWPRWFTPSQNMKDATGTEIICFRRDSENSGEAFCVGGKHYPVHEWKGDGLQLEEITEQEAQAIIAHSVKPTGEYLGCIQWFQHSQPSVIVRRDSHDRCTYFDQRLVTPGILWDYHMSQWVKSGDWKEITQQEAERRIEQNRMPAEPKAQEPQPGICKREQFGGGGTPSPRNCDVCLEGPCLRVIPVQSESGASSATQEPYSWQQLPADPRMMIAAQNVNTLPICFGDGSLQLQLRSGFDREGIWLYVVAGDLRLALCTRNEIEAGKYSFPIDVPCVHICTYPKVKWPVEYRNAAMPKDYGKEVMYFGDFGPEWGRGILRGLRTTGTGREDMIVEIQTEAMNGARTESIDSRRVFIIDGPTEGF